jgi:hypothetical protein
MISRDKEVRIKHVNLSVTQKLELIEKLEGGVTVARVCEIYSVKKQTVSDICKNKKKLNGVCIKIQCSKTISTVGGSRKHMKVAEDKILDEAVYKWFVQQRSSGVVVRGVELKSAAERLAKHMGLKFQGSNGWLWRFRKCHGIVNKRTCGESEMDFEGVEASNFRDTLLRAGNKNATENDVEQWLE